MSLRYQVEYLCLASFAAVMRGLPRPVALELGAAIGELGWLLRLRHRTVMSNLSQALPETTSRERRAIAARAARNFGRTVAEFVRFAGSDRTRLKELVTVEGCEPLRAELSGERGALVVTAHLGSWALYVTALAANGIPSALLVGRQHNPMVDAFILAIPGDAVQFISKGPTAPRNTLRCLKEGRAVVMVADQHTVHNGDIVPFLGRDAATLSLPAAIVRRHGYPLFLLEGHRVTRGTHRVEISPIALPDGNGEPRTRLEISARINQALGDAILRHPDQYFWYHRRWRDDVKGAGDGSTAQRT